MAKRKKLSSLVKRSRKISSTLMKKRKATQRAKRYSQQSRYFRPKLMVRSDGTVYASPNSGGSYKVNPRRKYMKRRKKASTKRRVTRRYRRNPGILKASFNKKHIINIASLGVGFVGGIKAQKYINNMEALMRFRKFTGIIPFILGTVLAVRSRKEAIKSVGAGLSLSGLYDLVTQNIPQIGLSPVEGVDLEDDSMYGTAIDVDGTAIDVEGMDYDTTVVGDDDIDMVGDSSPYAMV